MRRGKVREESGVGSGKVQGRRSRIASGNHVYIGEPAASFCEGISRAAISTVWYEC